MKTNRIIYVILSIVSIFVIPIQIITTFILGIFVSITFGLLLLPISLIWIIFFFAPLLFLSYIFEKYTLVRFIASLIGIPLAILGDIYVALMPSMGEMESRYTKMIYCQTFPYTWRYHRFCMKKITLNKNNELNFILENISSSNKVLGEYLKIIS